MIAKIRKYTFLVYHKDYHDLLDSLRRAGVVHIVERRRLEEDTFISDNLRVLKRYRNAIRLLSQKVPGATPSENHGEPEESLDYFESRLKEADELSQQIDLLKAEAEKLRPWGDFDPLLLSKIADSGWKLSFFVCPEKRFREEWEKDLALEIIGHERGKLYFTVIHKTTEEPDIMAEQQKSPEKTAGAVMEEIAVRQDKINEIESEITEKGPLLLSAMKDGLNELISRLEYYRTSEQADKYAEDNLYVLEGWVPLSEEGVLEEVMQKSDCYSYVSEPDEKEKIPVILTNNRFASLFEPIARMFSLPYYREMDLTPFFAPFFMLFFGFCLGDAGYGLVFVLGGFIVRKKIAREFRPFVSLAQYLGIAAVFFGLLSGTLFGINLIDTGYTITEQSVIRMKEDGAPEGVLSVISQVKGENYKTKKEFSEKMTAVLGEEDYGRYSNIILKNTESDYPVLNSFRHLMQDSLSMFYLAIIIGGMQIIFGMILKIFNITRQQGFKYSLSTIGWVILAITLVIFKGGGKLGLIDETGLKPLFNILLIIAGVLIFLLNTPGLNIFLRVGKGVWDSYNVLTGVFGDLLSYIRLFALGISSSILGFVFNDISSQMLSVPYIGWLFFLILLIAGHTINIALATLGSFVHPMRLTFVEFYKNAGFTGGGIEYKPFKIKQ